MDDWNTYELIEFFGVVPEEDEDKAYLSFTVEKDGLRLEATFFRYAFDVYLDVFREGVKESLFTAKLESPGVNYIRHANGWEALELSATKMAIAVRLKVNPHISIELFQSPAALRADDSN